jgi:hypothetical protein
MTGQGSESDYINVFGGGVLFSDATATVIEISTILCLFLESPGFSTHSEITMANMKAIVVEEHGDVTKLVAKRVPKPEKPQGHDILVR